MGRIPPFIAFVYSGLPKKRPNGAWVHPSIVTLFELDEEPGDIVDQALRKPGLFFSANQVNSARDFVVKVLSIGDNKTEKKWLADMAIVPSSKARLGFLDQYNCWRAMYNHLVKNCKFQDQFDQCLNSYNLDPLSVFNQWDANKVQELELAEEDERDTQTIEIPTPGNTIPELSDNAILIHKLLFGLTGWVPQQTRHVPANRAYRFAQSLYQQAFDTYSKAHKKAENDLKEEETLKGIRQCWSGKNCPSHSPKKLTFWKCLLPLKL
jgi:hypothetical protein